MIGVGTLTAFNLSIDKYLPLTMISSGWLSANAVLHIRLIAKREEIENVAARRMEGPLQNWGGAYQA